MKTSPADLPQYKFVLTCSICSVLFVDHLHGRCRNTTTQHCSTTPPQRPPGTKAEGSSGAKPEDLWDTITIILPKEGPGPGYDRV